MPDESNGKAIAAEALNHLDALASSPSFKWFMETIVTAIRDEQQEKALSTTLDALVCERARHCRAIAQTILDAPTKRRLEWEKTLKRP